MSDSEIKRLKAMLKAKDAEIEKFTADAAKSEYKYESFEEWFNKFQTHPNEYYEKEAFEAAREVKE